MPDDKVFAKQAVCLLVLEVDAVQRSSKPARNVFAVCISKVANDDLPGNCVAVCCICCELVGICAGFFVRELNAVVAVCPRLIKDVGLVADLLAERAGVWPSLLAKPNRAGRRVSIQRIIGIYLVCKLIELRCISGRKQILEVGSKFRIVDSCRFTVLQILPEILCNSLTYQFLFGVTLSRSIIKPVF